MNEIVREKFSTSVALSTLGRQYYVEEGTPERDDELYDIATDFRTFLRYWHFIDQDTGVIRNLGEELWQAQEEFVTVTKQFDWIFFLKARQLGESTIECAYDAWVLRFRGAYFHNPADGVQDAVTVEGAKNARVHIFHKREKEAQSLLGRVKFGLERLPPQLQLPVTKDTQTEYELNAGEDDRRLGVAYPADNDTARGETCTHAHVDEWAFMGNPSRVWQSIEPSSAGTVHILTTGMGPENFTSQFWQRCLTKDAKDRRGQPIHPCFIGALSRPDRNMRWLKQKRAGMDEDAFLREYPMKWQDAISGHGETMFRTSEIIAAGTDFRGMSDKKPGRKYIQAWDIGRHQDAAVGICLDVTEDVHDIVGYKRLRSAPYPFIQREIRLWYEQYRPALIAIEKNAAGEAVLENLEGIPEYRLEGFTTSQSSKARILQQLKVALQNQLIKWDPVACEQLDQEMRGYQIPDDNVVQDSVIALAIALEHAPRAHAAGRLLGISAV